ncbi:PIN domain-containing protein [Thioalkalicoccus limnaeus]|uniref:PIN domain-containing protein n=1 Tax=Thioalkalicoccus limnaeus TaxID=120681 RepID=A0ABV4BFN9_9GAMM
MTSRHLCGIDPDPRVVDKPYLDEGRVGVGEAIPDPEFADNASVHLPDPAPVFAEVARPRRRRCLSGPLSGQLAGRYSTACRGGLEIDTTSRVESLAGEFASRGVKPMDALHVASAIEAGAAWFLTTDRALLRKTRDDDRLKTARRSGR